ncbi:hypothetical protein BU26DRAFT_523036 [Trematosphaeria pertusa]|uniref:Uncharacterized protein n=1 Tax=Trematosphaeria pertusa TaxID=390896 RepID=A0A6A6I265_9PLEO|nr:uncharacterized protein BU26DRAFT_523036 [Trematosphaeria pertusa]KAF2244376.1 hypothetical protein BU26DRAFT_523036 [Trematosphaeria pertusa]
MDDTMLLAVSSSGYLGASFPRVDGDDGYKNRVSQGGGLRYSGRPDGGPAGSPPGRHPYPMQALRRGL